MGSGSSNLNNYGFDNESQEYIVVMNEHLGYRYEIVKKLGKGSFGIVLRVFDHKTKVIIMGFTLIGICSSQNIKE